MKRNLVILILIMVILFMMVFLVKKYKSGVSTESIDGENIENEGKAVLDDEKIEENEFTFTMGYDGYIGYVKDSNGNYLYMPID